MPWAGSDRREDFVGIFGVTAGVAVGSPLSVEEVLDALALGFERLLILGIGAAVPARPDRWRIDVGNIARKVAAADSEAPNLDQAGQHGRGTDLNFIANCRQMDTVVTDQNGLSIPPHLTPAEVWATIR